MCGRFVVDKRSDDLVSLFEVDVTGENLPGPSWNIAPTQKIAVIIDAKPKGDGADIPVRRLESARWGLVPGWASDPSAGAPLFNARSESVVETKSFQGAVLGRRAAIPATGYYEWITRDNVKTPLHVSLPDDEVMLFAGLYEWWKNPAAPEGSPDRWLLSATILTRPSTGPLAEIHDRMPVFLDPEFAAEWLDPFEAGDELLVEQISEAAADVADRVGFHPVGTDVGNVANNSPALTAPLG